MGQVGKTENITILAYMAVLCTSRNNHYIPHRPKSWLRIRLKDVLSYLPVPLQKITTPLAYLYMTVPQKMETC